MTKAAYIRNCLVWAHCSLPEGGSLNIMEASMMATERRAWHGSSSLHIDPEAGSRESQQGTTWTFETSKYTTRDMSPPTQPHLLIIPKQHHQLWTKPSNIWVYGANSRSNHTNPKYLNRTFILSYQSFCTIGLQVYWGEKNQQVILLSRISFTFL